MQPILVIKFGTASITDQSGNPEPETLSRIARQVSDLRNLYRIVLVSSGAVGAGKHFISGYKGELGQKKAAAAVGNPILMALYSREFAKHEVAVAQSLCERGHFANRNQFLQLKNTYQTLWDSGIIPIANENDVVSDVELKFSDNDELATLLAAGFGADVLMFSTSVGGLLDKEGKIVPLVNKIDHDVWSLVDQSKSSLGLGGMLSKLSFARRANQLGIKVVIFSAREEGSISKALGGESGTQFLPQKVNRSLRQKWLSTGTLISAYVVVDEGAATALKARKSLLAVGVRIIDGEFEEGEVIGMRSESGEEIAVGRARTSSAVLSQNLKTKKLEVAHADDIVIL